MVRFYFILILICISCSKPPVPIPPTPTKISHPTLNNTSPLSEGVINQWLVKIGDTVKAGDIIAEIETDKATMELEAIEDGILTKLPVVVSYVFGTLSNNVLYVVVHSFGIKKAKLVGFVVCFWYWCMYLKL